MKIKRFFAPTMRLALAQVRAEIGADAVILSQHSAEGGVELVAAVDFSESALGKENKPPPANAESMPALADMRRELHSLRGLLEQRLSGFGWGELERWHPLQMCVIQALRRLNLGTDLCKEIAAGIDERGDFAAAWRRALALLAHRLAASDDDILERGGVVALVGPAGVGKTTTIAKLAARFVLRHGPRELALVSTDRERIGAHEQLCAYGRSLGVPATVAGEPAELPAALDALRGKRLVLIDTAGAYLPEAGLPSVQTYLVLSAATHRAGLDCALRQFSVAQPAGCIVTKLDEAASLGELISALVEHRLPVTYLSEGQRVPEDLRPARPHHLVSAAVVAAQRSTARGMPLNAQG